MLCSLRYYKKTNRRFVGFARQTKFNNKFVCDMETKLFYDDPPIPKNTNESSHKNKEILQPHALSYSRYIISFAYMVRRYMLQQHQQHQQHIRVHTTYEVKQAQKHRKLKTIFAFIHIHYGRVLWTGWYGTGNSLKHTSIQTNNLYLSSDSWLGIGIRIFICLCFQYSLQHRHRDFSFLRVWKY